MKLRLSFTLAFLCLLTPQLVFTGTKTDIGVILFYLDIEMHPFYEEIHGDYCGMTEASLNRLRKLYKDISFGLSNTALFWEGERIQYRMVMQYRGKILNLEGGRKWLRGVKLFIRDVASGKRIASITFDKDDEYIRTKSEPFTLKKSKRYMLEHREQIQSEKHNLVEQIEELSADRLYRLEINVSPEFEKSLRGGKSLQTLKYDLGSVYLLVRKPVSEQEESTRLFRFGYREYYLNKDAGKAERLFIQALKKYSNHMSSMKMLAHLYKEQKRYKEAIMMLNSIMEKVSVEEKEAIRREIRDLTRASIQK